MKKIKKTINRITTILLACAICLITINIGTIETKADAVTDTLTVKVGYWGCDLEQYVEVGTYHWAELMDELPLYEEAYSFYQGDDYSSSYTAIVDSARGFYISDILAYANIYVGDIYNLMFYVEDGQGIRSAFDYNTLFQTRYYFDNLAGHRTIHYGVKADGSPDYSIITGYTFEEAWDYATVVQPMLAIEDNWASFNEEFENIGPDFTSANAGNRFRLLFGQTEPTESLTGKSDKYVSSLYVTLWGSPAIGQMTDATGQYGANTVEFTISEIYNQDMTDMLSKYLNVQSTDGSVIVIDSIETISDSTYSDVSKVVVHYSVVGDGNASFIVGVGNNDTGVDFSESANIVVKDGRASFKEGPVTPEPETEEPETKETETKEPETKETETNPGGDEPETGETEPETKEPETETKEPETETIEPVTEKPTEEPEQNITKKETTDTDPQVFDIEEIDVEVVDAESLKTLTGVYMLSENIQELLGSNEVVDAGTTNVAEITKEVQEVVIEDNTEEKEDQKRFWLIITGLSALALCVIGIIVQVIVFRIRLKKTK